MTTLSAQVQSLNLAGKQYVSFKVYDDMMAVVEAEAYCHVLNLEADRPGVYFKLTPNSQWWYVRHSVSHQAKFTMTSPPHSMAVVYPKGVQSETEEPVTVAPVPFSTTPDYDSLIAGKQAVISQKQVELAELNDKIDIITTHSPLVGDLLRDQIIDKSYYVGKLQDELESLVQAQEQISGANFSDGDGEWDSSEEV